ncbi:MAG: DTW protein [uncultured bacterium]|nr:MAG: DTW protein [uncultured bacterium]
MYMDLCLCPLTPRLDLSTKIVIFMQQSEYSQITNTGVLAHRILKNSQIVFRGHQSKNVVKREDFLADRNVENTFVLYPSGNAGELNDQFLKKCTGAMTLICPDGHWGQAKKIVRHEPSLNNLPCLKLPEGAISNYRLRRNQQENNVCTIEAIICALGLLEGLQVREAMEIIFNKMVTRLLWARGKIPLDQIVW